MTTAADPDTRELTRAILVDARRELALDEPGLPATVRAAADEFAAAVRDVIDAAAKLDDDTAQLRHNWNMIPERGREELRRRSLTEAQERAQAGHRRAERAIASLRESLTDAALPTLDPARESLAREELALAIGNAEGAAALRRVRDIAAEGSREALAVLVRTPFGRTLLAGRGLAGHDLEEALQVARTIGAGTYTRATTPREMVAGAALQRVGKLAAANGAAGAVFARAVRNAEKLAPRT